MHTDLHNLRAHDGLRIPVAFSEHIRAYVTLAFTSRISFKVIPVW